MKKKKGCSFKKLFINIQREGQQLKWIWRQSQNSTQIYLTAFLRLFLCVRSEFPKSVVKASAKGNGEWSRNPLKAIKDSH